MLIRPKQATVPSARPNLAPEVGHPRAADPTGPWLEAPAAQAEGRCAALGSHSRWAQRLHSAWSPGAQVPVHWLMGERFPHHCFC